MKREQAHELRDEWRGYLEQKRRHEQIVMKLLEELGLEEEESSEAARSEKSRERAKPSRGRGR
jgi:hypothetical protein